MRRTIAVSGRTELAGSHTDHQNGRILASTIQMGLTAKVEPNDSARMRIRTHDFGLLDVSLGQLSVRPRDFGKPEALMRGVAAVFRELGLQVGGFDADLYTAIEINDDYVCHTFIKANAKGIPMVGVMYMEGMVHCLYPQYSEIIWDFCKHYSRNQETLEIEYNPYVR